MPFKHNLAFNGPLKKCPQMSTFVFLHRQNLEVDKIKSGHLWTSVDICGQKKIVSNYIFNNIPYFKFRILL